MTALTVKKGGVVSELCVGVLYSAVTFQRGITLFVNKHSIPLVKVTVHVG